AVGLGAGHGDVDVVAGEGAGTHLDAVHQGLFAHVGAPVPGGDDHVDLQAGGAQTHAFAAEEHHRAQVGAVQTVFTDRGALGFVDLILGERNLHIEDVSRVEQAVGVGLQTEDGGAARGVV